MSGLTGRGFSPLLALAVIAALPTAARSGEPAPDVLCFGREPTIWGGPDADHLVGTSGPDVIVGLGGNDLIEGKGGGDRICGGGGDDEIRGGGGKDRINGQGGSDLVLGNRGRDRLKGGSSGDVLGGGPGEDFGNGGKGSDVCGAESVKNCEGEPDPEVTIVTFNFGYTPDDAVVAAGAPIHFDIVGFHTATSASVPSGAAAFNCTSDCDLAPTVPGVYRFYCTIHGAGLMSGEFVVIDP